MEEELSILTGGLCLPYILSCNTATYIVISCLQKKPTTRTKRIISAVVAFLIGFFWIFISPEKEMGDTCRKVFVSFFIQFLTWDYCFKFVINFLKTKFDSSNIQGVIDKKKSSQKTSGDEKKTKSPKK